MEPIFIEKLYKEITPEEKNKVGENYFICLHSSDASGVPYFEYLVVLNNIKKQVLSLALKD